MIGGAGLYYDETGKIIEQYRKAPLSVLRAENLKDFSKLLYFELYTLHNAKTYQNLRHKGISGVFIKTKTLAERLIVSESYVTKHLKELEDKGYIKRRTSRYNPNFNAKRREIIINDLSMLTNDNKQAYSQFPARILSMNIRQSAKLVLIELYNLKALQDPTGNYLKVNKTSLADKLHKTPMTIYNSIKELEEKDIITVSNFTNKLVIHIEHHDSWQAG